MYTSCSAIGIVIVVLLIGSSITNRCTLLLCYRYSDSSITNR